MNVESQQALILGVDTHLDIHVGVVINELGQLLGTRSVSANAAGYAELLSWSSLFGTLTRAGVEGTGTYGAGLCRFLIDYEITVFEVNRPDRSNRRQKGKSDPTDAENAARSVLSGVATAIPKQQSGACEAMRIVSVARRSAVKAKTQAINQLRALLVSAPQEVREKLWRAKTNECVKACARVRSLGDSALLQTLASTLKALAKRWLTLATELEQLDKQLEALTQKHAQNLRSRFGVGPHTAAVLLSVAGDNPERLTNEAALAALCGVNPLPASSGKTIRHRLNRGGSRAANNALWTIAMVRMRSDPRTRAYVDRRTAEGLTSKEIHRCLKRYIVRELFPLIMEDLGKLREAV
ncbi:IS110 family transposase [Halomonas sp. H2]|uniref:IS110 family transposase n=1 Tax=Halomonas sp. H2 TaxID=261936 RepID=UPI003CF66A5E